MNNKKTKKFRFPKKIVLILGLVVLAAAVTGGLAIRNSSDKTQQIEQPGGPVTIAPATQQEKDDADAHKDELVQKDKADAEASQQTGKTTVTPVITYADQNGLNAYISGVFEDGGTCTATVKQGSVSFQKTSSAHEDATTTGCTPIDFSASDFPTTGTWSATVSYSSSTASGTSAPLTFTVK